MTMKPLGYADPKLLESYPGIQLTDEDRRKMDEATVAIEELMARPELIIYGLGQTLSFVLTALFSRLEEMTDEPTALGLARQLGVEFGKTSYGRFLKNRELPGGPSSMCAYQDFAHALKGPRQASALFATYDDRSVLVKRTDCVYFWGTRGEPNKYIQAFEEGAVEGYRQVDPSLDRVETHWCLCKGSSEGCEHLFVFKT